MTDRRPAARRRQAATTEPVDRCRWLGGRDRSTATLREPRTNFQSRPLAAVRPGGGPRSQQNKAAVHSSRRIVPIANGSSADKAAIAVETPEGNSDPKLPIGGFPTQVRRISALGNAERLAFRCWIPGDDRSVHTGRSPSAAGPCLVMRPGHAAGSASVPAWLLMTTGDSKYRKSGVLPKTARIREQNASPCASRAASIERHR